MTTQEEIKICARCGAKRTDDVNSDICGSCADDLRAEEESYSEAYHQQQLKESYE